MTREATITVAVELPDDWRADLSVTLILDTDTRRVAQHALARHVRAAAGALAHLLDPNTEGDR